MKVLDGKMLAFQAIMLSLGQIAALVNQVHGS